METIKDYLNEENLIKDQIYENLETPVICIICLDIIIQPIMCMKCKNVYCERCINNWSKKNNKCPNRCENPNYQICFSISKTLSKLNFNCKNCKKIINYNEMEKHFLSKCQLVKNSYSNDSNEKSLVERNYNFQKINNESKEPEMRLTSKFNYIFIFIFNLFIL